MVEFVFTVGVVNLALGYLTAAVLADPPPWSGLGRRLRPRQRRVTMVPPQKLAPEDDTEREPAAPSPPAGTSLAAASPATDVEELPASWLEVLSREGIVARSFTEATTEVLRLEVGRYREQLLALESRARALLASGDWGAIKVVAGDLQYVNRDWLDKQSGAADMLAKRAGRLGEHEASARLLEQVLLDQAAEIQASCIVLEGLDARAEAETGGKLILEQLAALIDHAHALRDQMQETLATLLQSGPRLASLPPSVQTDQLTQLPNRIGLEIALATWWREDPQRARPLSLLWIDIDRFSRLNVRSSTRAGDRTLFALARLIEEITRRDRGYDRLTRPRGQALCLVMGDTLPQQALTAAERLRQAVEAVTFDDQGAQFELTLSCGVVGYQGGESSAVLLRRAAETAKHAKKAGRNRCAIDEGSGPTLLDPPQYPVKGRVVLV